MNSLLSPRAKYPLLEDFYAYLWLGGRVFSSFLNLMASIELFLDLKPIVEVQTDACYDGIGAFCAGDWTYVHFVSTLPIAKDLHINYKETLAIVIAAEHWGGGGGGGGGESKKCIIIHCDKKPAVSIINKGSTHNSIAMSFFTQIVLVVSHL